MYELAPGQSYTHIYDTSRQAPGTVCLYHPHKHGLVGEQVWAGLIGPIVADDPDTSLAGYETHLMLLKDIGLSGADPAPHSSMMDFMMGKEGNIVTVNGQVNPRLTIKKGQVQRWRIVNASQARFYKIALDNHTLQLIGTDGGLLDKPYQVPYIILSPAERVDVLVKATQSSGSYKFKSLPYSRGGCGGCKSTGQTDHPDDRDLQRHPESGPELPGRRQCRGRAPHDRHRESSPQDLHAVDGERSGIHQRTELRRRPPDVHVDRRGLRGLDDRQPERHGSPLAPARRLGPGPLHQRGRSRYTSSMPPSPPGRT